MRDFRATLLTVLMAALLEAQPMDWSHHFAYNNNDAVSSFLLDRSDNIICIGTFALHGNVLFLSNDEINNCRNHFNTIPFNGFTYSLCKKNGDVLLYKKDTIYAFRSGDYQTPSLKVADTSINNVLSSVEINDGSVLIGTFSNKLLVLKNGEISLFDWPIGLTDHLLPCFYDSQKRIWAKTWNSGIYCYVNSQWVKYDKNNSGLQSNLFGDDGNNIIEDKNGDIIAVSNDENNDSSGIFIFNGSAWKRKSVDPGKSYYNCIRCIAIDSSGATWLGTLKGPVRIKGDSLYKYTINDIANKGAPEGFVRDIVVDKNNRVYFGTFHYCIYILDQDANFSCKNNQHVTITSPSENTSFHVSDTLMARWDSYGFSDSVLLQYQISNGTWMPCYSIISNPNRRNQFFYRWVIPSTLTPGSYLFRVSDSRNTAANDTVAFTIAGESQNVPPVFETIPDTIKTNHNVNTTYTLKATDADRNKLTYNAMGLPQWITLADSVLTIVPNSSSITQVVTLIVSDGNGGSDTAKIVVVPVPPVHATDKNNVGIKQRAELIVSRQFIEIKFPGENGESVKKAVLIDCAGKKIAEFAVSQAGFNIDRSIVNVSKGVYNCIVYSNDSKIVLRKTFQLLD
jgi:hypothetical protein